MPRSKNQLFDNLSTTENGKTYSIQEWFSSDEAAEYLRIPIGSLRNLACNGKLKVRGKIGRLNRYHIDDLRGLLARK